MSDPFHHWYEDRCKDDTANDWLSFKDLEYLMVATIAAERKRYKKITIDFVTFWRLMNQCMRALELESSMFTVIELANSRAGRDSKEIRKEFRCFAKKVIERNKTLNPPIEAYEPPPKRRKKTRI